MTDHLPVLPDVLELLAHDIEDMRVNGYKVGTQLVGRVRAIASQARKQLAAHDRQVAERAWDEAYQAGAYDTLRSPGDARENPYRADSLAPRPAAPASWCTNNDAHGPHSEPMPLGDYLTCSGRPAPPCHQGVRGCTEVGERYHPDEKYAKDAAPGVSVSARYIPDAIDAIHDAYDGDPDSDQGFARAVLTDVLAALGVTVTDGGAT